MGYVHDRATDRSSLVPARRGHPRRRRGGPPARAGAGPRLPRQLGTHGLTAARAQWEGPARWGAVSRSDAGAKPRAGAARPPGLAPGLLKFAGWLATNVVALAAAVLILDGIGFGDSTGWDQVADNFWALLFVALILGIVNSFVSPIIKFLSIPFIIITLGLFLLVINALMLLFTEWLVNLFDIDFYVDGFWNAVGGAIVITVVTWIVGLLRRRPG